MSRNVTPDIAERLRATVLRRLDPDLPPLLRERVAGATARWLAASPSRTRLTRHRHLRLSPEAARTLDRVDRALAWMGDPDRHHGEGAAEAARKALRAAESGRLDFPGLIAACATFQHHRHSAIRANALRKPRAKRLRITLPRTGASASRITSEAALAALGREAGNCLADLDRGDRYRRDLRAGDAEFWRIADAEDGLLLVVRTDPACDTVDEASGPRNAPPTPLARAALIEFMAARGLASMGLHRIAVSTSVVKATAAGTLLRRNALVAGVPCSLEIAPLTVAGLTQGRKGCWMLTSLGGRYGQWSWSASAFPVALADDDEELDEEEGVIEGIARSHLRAACRADPALARDLHAAFADAPDWFRDDWFGPSPGEGTAQ
ncbi:hypothetical protein [Roseomonas chloroacetimidivorans]|uniref:hypothetical protein n=1 Tax=Roseomonas chloroacetimidivorans TaxID=1766656 RepID=UPI003C721F9D